MRLFGAGEIAEALSEAREECYREPDTDLWKSFWDRLTEGHHIPLDPLERETDNDYTPNTGRKTHDYKMVNSSYHPTIEKSANYWAERGWRVVGVISATRPGHATALVLERPVGVTHPDD